MTARSVASKDLFDIIKTASPSPESALSRLQFVANLLDSAFRVPGTKQRIGIDAIIGLVPGIGDVVTTVLSTYIIWEAKNLGVSKLALGRMLTNLGIHAAIGSIPIIGDMFDAFFRVNQRNMRILRAQLGVKASRASAAANVR